MTAREKLQAAYELAFQPACYFRVWNRVKNGEVDNLDEIKEIADMAWCLHQALPETGYASQRALKRLANYQADARAFSLVTLVERLRNHLALPPLDDRVVPGHMVRDIALPPLARR